MNGILDKIFDCPKCGNRETINLEDYVVAQSSNERQMGPEIEYIIEGSYICSKCSAHYNFEGSIWEYPMGALNLDEVKIKD